MNQEDRGNRYIGGDGEDWWNRDTEGDGEDIRNRDIRGHEVAGCNWDIGWFQ